MKIIGKPERVTQNRVIKLFHEEHGYEYRGDYQLKTTSRARGAGMDARDLGVTFDLAGRKRPDGPTDAGALLHVAPGADRSPAAHGAPPATTPPTPWKNVSRPLQPSRSAE